MSFSIDLDYFVNRISDINHKNLITKHHNLIKKHIESMKQLILIKKDLLKLYKDYNNEVSNNNEINMNNNYFDIMKYIQELEETLIYLDKDGINQKEFFKKNIFYLSNF